MRDKGDALGIERTRTVAGIEGCLLCWLWAVASERLGSTRLRRGRTHRLALREPHSHAPWVTMASRTGLIDETASEDYDAVAKGVEAAFEELRREVPDLRREGAERAWAHRLHLKYQDWVKKELEGEFKASETRGAGARRGTSEPYARQHLNGLRSDPLEFRRVLGVAPVVFDHIY